MLQSRIFNTELQISRSSNVKTIFTPCKNDVLGADLNWVKSLIVLVSSIVKSFNCICVEEQKQILSNASDIAIFFIV